MCVLFDLRFGKMFLRTTSTIVTSARAPGPSARATTDGPSAIAPARDSKVERRGVLFKRDVHFDFDFGFDCNNLMFVLLLLEM
jgi:hypothetical protein